LFSVGMLLTAMGMTDKGQAGLVLGAWGAVQATASGLAMALGGVTRDLMGNLAEQGMLGEALVSPVTGYSMVFHIEMYMLFCVLIALGPLVSRKRTQGATRDSRFGLAELPG
jgi:BCD family chlorophyll transporter-like MFS transporter